jgi:hypothetical protein
VIKDDKIPILAPGDREYARGFDARTPPPLPPRTLLVQLVGVCDVVGLMPARAVAAAHPARAAGGLGVCDVVAGLDARMCCAPRSCSWGVGKMRGGGWA